MNHKKQYAINKIKYKFRHISMLQPLIEEKQMDELSDTPPIQRTDFFIDTMEKIRKLRKNSKRRLELLIIKYKHDINKLPEDEKGDLLDFIASKFYPIKSDAL